MLGGLGTGYVEANVFGIGPGADACFLCRASASILGGINDIGGGCSDQGCRNFLFGPFTFGQPFQVTLTASASAYYPEAASDQGGSGDLQEIDILGVVDSSGNPIAGAFPPRYRSLRCGRPLWRDCLPCSQLRCHECGTDRRAARGLGTGSVADPDQPAHHRAAATRKMVLRIYSSGAKEAYKANLNPENPAGTISSIEHVLREHVLRA